MRRSLFYIGASFSLSLVAIFVANEGFSHIPGRIYLLGLGYGSTGLFSMLVGAVMFSLPNFGALALGMFLQIIFLYGMIYLAKKKKILSVVVYAVVACINAYLAYLGMTSAYL